MMVQMQKPFFLGVGLIRPHLPFVVPTDMWRKYAESEIKLPASKLPPVNAVNISLNDQIFSGSKTFCLPGDNSTVDCPSAERSTIPVSNGISPFNPFTDSTIKFLRHGYYAAVSFMDEQVGRLVDHLQLRGQTDKTIVVFHGDHGW
eukprot:SAG31_NODE_339_length_17487_cov_20.764435_12_plen_146_part_00